MCKLVTIELRAQGAAVGELEATLPAPRGSGKRSRRVPSVAFVHNGIALSSHDETRALAPRARLGHTALESMRSIGSSPGITNLLSALLGHLGVRCYSVL